jgi:hypothetical protein
MIAMRSFQVRPPEIRSPTIRGLILFEPLVTEDAGDEPKESDEYDHDLNHDLLFLLHPASPF